MTLFPFIFRLVRSAAVFAAGVVFCVSCTPVDPRADLKAALALMASGDYAGARPKAAACLSLDRDCTDAILANAICVYAEVPRPPEDVRKQARLALQRAAASLAPLRFDVWYTMTWVLVQERDFSSAISAARTARTLYRSRQEPALPQTAECDDHDLRLAQSDAAYANLLVLTADICRHNRLEEGLSFFWKSLHLATLQRVPEIYLAMSQLFFDFGRHHEAYTLLKRISGKDFFPDNLPIAYNLAYIDEFRQSRRDSVPAKLRETLKERYRAAAGLAERQNRPDIAARARERLARLK